MSLNFPKHPKDMNREELFDRMQQVQSVARKNNKHSPMPTRTTLREGQTPTPADLHEEAARKELAGYYEEQVAMAGLPQAAEQTAGIISEASQKTVEAAIGRVLTQYEMEKVRDMTRAGYDLETVIKEISNTPESRAKAKSIKNESKIENEMRGSERGEYIKKKQNR